MDLEHDQKPGKALPMIAWGELEREVWGESERAGVARVGCVGHRCFPPAVGREGELLSPSPRQCGSRIPASSVHLSILVSWRTAGSHGPRPSR